MGQLARSQRGRSSSRSSAVVLVSKLSGSAASLIVIGFLTKTLPIGDVGQYATIIAVATLLSVVASAGQPALLVREIGHSATGDGDARMAALRRASLISVVVAVIAAAMWIVASQPVALAVALGAALVPALGLLAIIEAVLQGAGHPVAGALTFNVFRPFLLLGAVLMLSVSDNLSPATAMLANVGASALSALVGVGLIAHSTHRRDFDHRALTTDHSRWLRASLGLLILGGVGVLSNRIDILFLAWLSTDEAVGTYFNASSFASVPVLALTAVNAVVLPEFTRHYASADHAAAQNAASTAARFAATVTPAAILLVIVLYVALIPLRWTVRDGLVILTILSLGQLVNAASGSSGGILIMAGRTGIVTGTYVASTLINIALNVLLIPHLQSVGAALATATSLSCWNLFLVYQARSLLGIDPSIAALRSAKRSGVSA